MSVNSGTQARGQDAVLHADRSATSARDPCAHPRTLSPLRSAASNSARAPGVAMVRRVYGHLGEVRHRSKHVEYRVGQHKKKLGERLEALSKLEVADRLSP